MRILRVERIYALGNYSNLKLSDEYQVPEGFEDNEELVNKIRYLQFVNLELHHKKYLKLIEKLNQNQDSDLINLLEEMKETLSNQINNILKGK